VVRRVGSGGKASDVLGTYTIILTNHPQSVKVTAGTLA